jgi:hypothetical protein
MVKTGGFPQTIGLSASADRKKDAEVLTIFAALRGVRDNKRRLSNSSFNKSPQFIVNRR